MAKSKYQFLLTAEADSMKAARLTIQAALARRMPDGISITITQFKKPKAPKYKTGDTVLVDVGEFGKSSGYKGEGVVESSFYDDYNRLGYNVRIKHTTDAYKYIYLTSLGEHELKGVSHTKTGKKHKAHKYAVGDRLVVTDWSTYKGFHPYVTVVGVNTYARKEATYTVHACRKDDNYYVSFYDLPESTLAPYVE